MRIRPEREDDFPAIHQLIESAFRTARYSEGDEHHFVARLRYEDGYIPNLALVVEDQKQLTGHIMLTRLHVSVAEGSHPILYLAEICVIPGFQRQGIGAWLIRHALQLARAQGYSAVMVLGDPAYYSRFGFEPSSAFGIHNTNGFDDINVMALELLPGGLKGTRGTVTLPA